MSTSATDNGSESFEMIVNPDSSIDLMKAETSLMNEKDNTGKVWNRNYPPIRYSFGTWSYIVSPLRRRGCVGLKEIGTEHEYFPDIFLCACLGTPGIFYAIVAVEDPLWLRIVIAIENAIVGLVSVIADGCLYTMSSDDSNRNGLLDVDRITSGIHIFVLLAVVIYRLLANLMSTLQFIVALLIGLLSIIFFHRRLYFSFVEQDWRKARDHARLWHIGGVATSFVALAPKFG